MPFGIQPIHLIIVVVVALIIFGPQRLPEIGRGLGKSINEFRKGAKEMTEGFRDEVIKPDEAAPVQAQPVAAAGGPAGAQPMAAGTVPTAAPVATATAATVTCPQCGSPNPTGAGYCSKCGSKLAY